MPSLRRKLLRYGISQIIIPFFAFIMTYIPNLAWLFFLLYFIIFMGISITMSKRAYSGKASDKEEIVKAKRLMSVSAKEVQQLMMKDKYLMEDIKAQAAQGESRIPSILRNQIQRK